MTTAQNKAQYQRGLSMREFFERYGSPEQCEALVRAWLTRRLRLPAPQGSLAQRVPPPRAAELPVQRLPLGSSKTAESRGFNLSDGPLASAVLACMTVRNVLITCRSELADGRLWPATSRRSRVTASRQFSTTFGRHFAPTLFEAHVGAGGRLVSSLPDRTDVVLWRVPMLRQPSAEHFHVIAEIVLTTSQRAGHWSRTFHRRSGSWSCRGIA